MAVIVDKLQLIYFLAPGTGSTSVQNFLITNYSGRNVPESTLKDRDGKILLKGKHSTFSELLNKDFLDEKQANFLKLTGTRNPYDFFYADWYRHRTRWIKEIKKKSSWVFDKPKKLNQIVECVTMDFSEWIVNKLRRHYEQKRQIMMHREYVRNADKFIRMEHMNEDIKKILSDILQSSAFEVSIPKINVTSRV